MAVAVRLTFLRILQVAHPCIFLRARPALGDRRGPECGVDSELIVADGSCANHWQEQDVGVLTGKKTGLKHGVAVVEGMAVGIGLVL